MNDKDLSALIRMATEAERLEEPAPLRFAWAKADRADTASRVRTAVTGIVSLAAAACLGFVALTWMKPTSTQPLPVAVAPTEVQPVVETAPEVIRLAKADSAPEVEIGSVIMAVFRDADERCSCIQINAADFEGRLSDVGQSEILRRALANACHDNPRQVLVIAMQGPKDELPTTAAEAELLAAAVREDAGHCGSDAMCISSEAVAYMPSSVTVLTSTLLY
jgi:hypothetical protein